MRMRSARPLVLGQGPDTKRRNEKERRLEPRLFRHPCGEAYHQNDSTEPCVSRSNDADCLGREREGWELHAVFVCYFEVLNAL